jgi:hypothetical protein
MQCETVTREEQRLQQLYDTVQLVPIDAAVSLVIVPVFDYFRHQQQQQLLFLRQSLYCLACDIVAVNLREKKEQINWKNECASNQIRNEGREKNTQSR